METADLPTIVRDYLKGRSDIGVSQATGVAKSLIWIDARAVNFLRDQTKKERDNSPWFIAFITDSKVVPIYANDADIHAADKDFFQKIDRMINHWIKETHNG